MFARRLQSLSLSPLGRILSVSVYPFVSNVDVFMSSQNVQTRLSSSPSPRSCTAQAHTRVRFKWRNLINHHHCQHHCCRHTVEHRCESGLRRASSQETHKTHTHKSEQKCLGVFVPCGGAEFWVAQNIPITVCANTVANAQHYSHPLSGSRSARAKKASQYTAAESNGSKEDAHFRGRTTGRLWCLVYITRGCRAAPCSTVCFCYYLFSSCYVFVGVCFFLYVLALGVYTKLVCLLRGNVCKKRERNRRARWCVREEFIQYFLTTTAR